MLKQPKFHKSTVVRNKGVDIAVVTDSAQAETALLASKQLGVIGISTAVLEVQQDLPPDPAAIGYFAAVTGAMLFTSKALYTACGAILAPTILTDTSEAGTAESIVRLARALAKHKHDGKG